MYRHAMPSRVDQIWNEQKKKLQLQFSKLTDEDLYFETGRKYEMIKKIGVKLGKTEAEMKRIFQEL
ncbi:MAG: general stress protein CsbD [Bacteroidota bacterium]|nr:general stress protein CsbD [Bacteroidota bacterium]